MRITGIETFATEAVCMVRVTTAAGDQGLGQTAPFNADITAQVLHRQIAPLALGADADDVEGLSARSIEANLKFPWSYVCRALCGVETALWDLRGKLAGKSVCELLGSTPRPIPVYGSSMRRDISPPDEADRLVRLMEAEGYRAFKVRVGAGVGHDADQWPGRTEELIPTIRRAVGDGITLMADGNSGYTPGRAIEVGHLLEDSGYFHFEEPCPYWELEWTAAVAAALQMNVAGGEQDNDLAQWRRMIAMRAVDIVQPDVCYLGGMTRTMAVARMAHEAGMLCVPHSANRSLVSVFTLHLLAAIPNAGPYMEFTIEPSGWTDELFDPPLRCVDGHVAVPESPGWGVTVNPDWLERADRLVSE